MVTKPRKQRIISMVKNVIILININVNVILININVAIINNKSF